jgi:hypothetical protein
VPEAQLTGVLPVETADRQERLRRFAAAADAARQAWEDARETRDREIEAADQEDNMSCRAIGRSTGLHFTTIDRIIGARTAARQARLRTAAGL